MVAFLVFKSLLSLLLSSAYSLCANLAFFFCFLGPSSSNYNNEEDDQEEEEIHSVTLFPLVIDDEEVQL